MDNSSLLKVMIVDDEKFERNLLRICIKWHEVGMQIVSDMSSAREALDNLENINPDIIITDICMPFMDGLEFSKIVAETYPFIRVIILTAHEEFEYAKEGIKIGISDFLLKPIRRIELQNTLHNIRDKILKEREKIYHQEELKKQLADSFPYLKEKFLNELISSKASKEDILKRMKYFSIDSQSDCYQITLIEPNDSSDDVNEQARVFLVLNCIELIKAYFRNDTGIEIFTDNSQKIVILNSNNTINLEHCCEYIKAMIINKLKCYVSMGIGNKYSELLNIKFSYKEALEALNYRIILGNNNIICFKDTNIDKNIITPKIDEINEIGFNIKIGATEKVMTLIDSTFCSIENSKMATIEHIRVNAINIVTAILNSLAELGINYDEVLGNKELPYSKVLKIKTLPEIKTYIKNMVNIIIGIITTNRSRKTNKMVGEIIEYIKKNLSDPKLSLTNVAKSFYLNISYLSRIFKNETGYTFIEYITKTRIELSTELFRNTDLMLYEVAEKVGIPDPNYFGKCFKKQLGMSVNDYKKQYNFHN